MNKIDEKLSTRLEVIQKNYGLDKLLEGKTENNDVAKYYRLSDPFYNIINSIGGGNIHMPLSDDDKFHRKDFKRQAEFITKHISNNTKKVLEVGAGKVANTKYLAKRFRRVKFTALDLPNRNFLKTKVPQNVSLIEGDYNNLSNLEPNNFDIVFAVETISYSKDKENVFHQISRLLKPGGVLIIFDAYESHSYEKMSDFQKYISSVVFASMKVTPKDHYIGDTKKYLKNNGFVDIQVRNITEKIRPNLRRLEILAKIYFKLPLFAKILRIFIPDDVTMNSIAAYLMNLTTEKNYIHEYDRIVAKKHNP